MPTKTEKPRKHYSSPATTKAFVAKNNTNKTPKLQCFYCKKQHYSNQCTEVTDVKDRKATLMEENRCFNCLRKGHAVKLVQVLQSVTNVKGNTTRPFVTNWKRQLLQKKNQATQ